MATNIAMINNLPYLYIPVALIILALLIRGYFSSKKEMEKPTNILNKRRYYQPRPKYFI